jgi:DNA-binding transcriptional MocR family regulator
MSFALSRAVERIVGLTTPQVALLGKLCAMADAKGTCWPSHERLAELMGCSRRTIIRTMAQLEKMGWVTRQRRHRADGSRTTDLITVHDPETVLQRQAQGLQLSLMLPLPGGKPCGQAGENCPAYVTQSHLGLSDTESQQERINLPAKNLNLPMEGEPRRRAAGGRP